MNHIAMAHYFEQSLCYDFHRTTKASNRNDLWVKPVKKHKKVAIIMVPQV